MTKVTNFWFRSDKGQGKVIALIHGIGAGNPRDYWQKFLDVLKDDNELQDFDLYVWQYPNHIQPSFLKYFLSVIKDKSLINTAPPIKQLGAAWKTTYESVFKNYKEVILVCHSMGGLVVKSWIIDVLDDGKSADLDTLQHIAFYATPHNGAPITALASWNKQLKDMKLDSPFIADVGSRWDRHVVAWKKERPEIQHCFYNRYIPHLVIVGLTDDVVPHYCATIRGMEDNTRHILGNHSTVIQPSSSQDIMYKVWRASLDKFLPGYSKSETVSVPSEHQTGDLVWAQKDFVTQLKRLADDDTIEIQHLGLDMFTAKEEFFNMLKSDFQAKKVKIKLLTITDNLNKFNGQLVPPAVERMTKQVKPAVDNIIAHLDSLNDEYKRIGKQITVEIRNYAWVPAIHGFRLFSTHDNKEKHIATYYSFCRWNQDLNDLEWGENSYHCIIGESKTLSSSKDMMAIFHGEFSRLWKISEELETLSLGMW